VVPQAGTRMRGNARQLLQLGQGRRRAHLRVAASAARRPARLNGCAVLSGARATARATR